MRRKGFGETAVIVSLLVLTLWFRVSTQMITHTGVDERDYWTSAKALSQGYEYPELSHRTVRWAVILPVALIQLLFGVHPNVYYIAPVLNALAQTFLVYIIGRRLKNRMTGIIAAFFMIFFPYQIRAASQVRPEIFSMTYILLAVFFFIKYLADGNRGRRPLVSLCLSSLMIFVSYEAKITNLFFLPGFFAAILLFGKKNGIRHDSIFGTAAFPTEQDEPSRDIFPRIPYPGGYYPRNHVIQPGDVRAQPQDEGVHAESDDAYQADNGSRKSLSE